ncbi:MAG: LysM peptidoglycan-binding domain-containing protein [Anaerolineales bacterium]
MPEHFDKASINSIHRLSTPPKRPLKVFSCRAHGDKNVVPGITKSPKIKNEIPGIIGAVAIIFILAALIGFLLLLFNLGSIPTPSATKLPNSIPTFFPTSNVPGTYTLQVGEYLLCLGRRFDKDPSELLTLNGLTDQDIITHGMTIKIPSKGNFPGNRTVIAHPATYVVQANDTIYSVACRYGGVEPMNIAAVNNLIPPYTLTVGASIQIP